MAEGITEIESTVHPNAQLLDYSTIIRSQIGDNCIIGKFSKITYSEMSSFSYTGDFTIVINSKIGKFASISWGVTIGPEDHDYRRLTSHSFLYSVKSFQLTPYKHYNPFERECIIGNDVWIGCNATILRGVKIGDGAVIGANSLVNKDVPPYSIAVGNPAKIIKYRFEDKIIKQLLDLKWWDLPLEIISANTELFAAEPTQEIINQIAGLKKNII